MKKNTPLPSSIGVIYARYSSHNQKEESIEQQVEECMAFALANNIQIIEVYADKAISGKTDKRSNFQRMMRDAEKQKFTAVIAYKSNRIARNMLNALTYESKLESFGIRTLYAKEEFGNTAAGRFALRTMMNVNQFYSENMAEDIRRGMADNAADCKVNGRLPLGYKNVDGYYAIDEPSAAIVREIFERFLSKETLAGIAMDLNRRGIKTAYGNLWNKGSFHRLLKNDNYIGTYRNSGVVRENGIPAIVTKEVFYAVQNELKEKKGLKGRKRENSDYLLTGKLKCGYCGSFMVGISGTSNTGAMHYYYSCNDHRLSGNCQKKNARRDWLEQRIAELTRDCILHRDVIEWIADNAVEFQKQARRTVEVAAMENSLAEARKASKNIMSAIEQGIITATTKSRLMELEVQIADLERSLAISRSMNDLVDRDRIIYALEKLQSGNVTDKSYQEKLINTFVKMVYLWDDRIRIDYYYAGKKNSITCNLSSDDGMDFDSEELVNSSYKLPSAPPKTASIQSDGGCFYLLRGDSNHNMQMSGGHLLIPGWTGMTPYIVPSAQWHRISSGPPKRHHVLWCLFYRNSAMCRSEKYFSEPCHLLGFCRHI